MKEIKNINEILKLHEKWLNNEEGGVKADLSYANLSYANLSCANLSHAQLLGTNLSHANLSFADLSFANLSGANLSHAHLLGTNLSHAYLLGTNLSGTNLSGTNLYNIRYDFRTSFFALQCPEKGSFIGFKKAFLPNSDSPVIVEIMITEDAKRSSATTRKCRCSKAKVLSITSIDGSKEYLEAVSKYDKNFYYKVGDIIEVENFNENRWDECSEGIHFFISREEAIQY